MGSGSPGGLPGRGSRDAGPGEGSSGRGPQGGGRSYRRDRIVFKFVFTV